MTGFGGETSLLLLLLLLLLAKAVGAGEAETRKGAKKMDTSVAGPRAWRGEIAGLMDDVFLSAGQGWA
jgi:hypothetical protein